MRRTLISWDVWTNEHAEIAAASPRAGMPRLRKARVPSPVGRRSAAHHTLWSEFRADSRTRTARGFRRDQRPSSTSRTRSGTTTLCSNSGLTPTKSPCSPTAAPSLKARPNRQLRVAYMPAMWAVDEASRDRPIGDSPLQTAPIPCRLCASLFT